VICNASAASLIFAVLAVPPQQLLMLQRKLQLLPLGDRRNATKRSQLHQVLLLLLLPKACTCLLLTNACCAAQLAMLLLLLLLLTLLRYPAHSQLAKKLQVRNNLATMSSSIHEASCPDHARALRDACKGRQILAALSAQTGDSTNQDMGT
jgi:hypothetical protein